jgi:hypothetical protein
MCENVGEISKKSQELDQSCFRRKKPVLFQDLCPSYKGICPAMKTVDGGEFYKKYLLKVSFTGPFTGTVASEFYLKVFLL